MPIMSVSYTHLDVYKRQVLTWVNQSDENIEEALTRVLIIIMKEMQEHLRIVIRGPGKCSDQ